MREFLVQQQPRRWVFAGWCLLLIQVLLSIGVLFLDLNLDNMESTRIYLGFFQALIGILLSVACALALYFLWKTVIMLYVVCSIILNLAVGVMFILVQLSEDIQYYNEEAPLQPAHTKRWFRFYKAYFILSLTLSTYSLLITPIFCRLTSALRRRRGSGSRPVKNASGIANVTTNNSETKPPMTSINCLEEDTTAKVMEFQKPLLLKDCQISFEPHNKGFDGSQKGLINSLKSQKEDDEIRSSDDGFNGNCPYSFPPMGFKEREIRVLKKSDNLRSVDRGRPAALGVIRKGIKKG